MPFQLGWIRPPAATVLHLIRSIAAGYSPADPSLQQTLAPLALSIPSPSIEPNLWRDAIGGTAVPPLADETEETPNWLEQLLLDATNRLEQLRPNLVDELTHRQRPLHEQWLARGPGFIRQLERNWLAQPLPIPQMQLICLLPVRGGFGEIHPRQQVISWEAVLTNIDEQVPELARLAFLIAHLQLQSLPSIAMTLPRQLVALLVTMRIVDELEWFPVSPEIFARAAHLWDLDSADNSSNLGQDLFQLFQQPDLATHLFGEPA
jgi:hypothetical protein